VASRRVQAPRRFYPAKKSEPNHALRSSNHHQSHLNLSHPYHSTTVKMVKLTEVEDEHFTEKPTATKNDVLLVSDDEDEDYSDTGKNSRFCAFQTRKSHHASNHHLAFPIKPVNACESLLIHSKSQHGMNCGLPTPPKNHISSKSSEQQLTSSRNG